MSRYLARTEKDMEFDKTIRSTVKKSKSKTSMAMFLQGQEQLNLLREIIVKQEEMENDISALAFIISKAPILQEQFGTEINNIDISKHIENSFKKFEMKLDDFIEYLCEEKDYEIDSDLHRHAIATIRLADAKAAKRYKDDPSEFNKRSVETMDYILSCLMFCGNIKEENK